jgi:ribose transport system ATP-binding protein
MTAPPDTANPASVLGPILQMRSVRKAYGATIAVGNVSFDIEPGEVHALVGENGAGKSTIVKILSGTVARDSGGIDLEGFSFEPVSPIAARLAGISTAFQELSLLPNLTVAQNLMLPCQVKSGAGLVSASRNRAAAISVLAEFGLGHIHPDLLVRSLSLAEKQRVEIMRAASRKPKLLVLDEPTAALADPNWLFEILDRLTQSGTGVLYISHRLSEVRRLCRRATILRNGESVETVPLAGVGDSQIFEMMVGVSARSRDKSASRPDAVRRPVAVSVKDLVGGAVRAISMDVHQGEIVGVAGLEGQGQRDLFRILGGLSLSRKGGIWVDGRPVVIRSPMDSVRAGIGFVPEERKTEGLFLGLKTSTNMTFPVIDTLSKLGVIDQSRENTAAGKTAARVDLVDRYLKLNIGALSGGNQQKALIGRALLSGARNLVLFDPTRGVDVGTKAVIYDVIREFVDRGGSALVYSTELSELVNLVDRCFVIYGGQIAGEVSGSELTEQRLVALAAGHGAPH